ncbi:5-formyltetrahydrofolate cyclo-ligase [Methanocorpusculaceae archaeon Cs1]|uniref:5-formyltetrahydrofolate cyclo-ligase n=2 Tax=Methanorbis rubei TaxID=3028300 RepID=A0AAE4MGC8_9EURY|nr:5-formyltetrahydrofolate cyclo-ligase [Methanocorpusculaceae archaeon Cs1]
MFIHSHADNSTMPSKAEIREHLRSVRDALTLEERREKSYYITEHLIRFLKPYTTVFAYVSKEPEVESLVIINSLLGAGKTVIVPIIDTKTKTLRLSYLTSVADLEPGTFQVPEPLSAEIPADIDKIEIALLPLIGFDRSGNRIGYGAGYYDRFFDVYPDIPRIGLAYACQEVDRIPAESYDRKMDWIVTENGITICNPARPKVPRNVVL